MEIILVMLKNIGRSYQNLTVSIVRLIPKNKIAKPKNNATYAKINFTIAYATKYNKKARPKLKPFSINVIL